jgi:hypothetical protein
MWKGLDLQMLRHRDNLPMTGAFLFAQKRATFGCASWYAQLNPNKIILATLPTIPGRPVEARSVKLSAV